MPRYERGGNTAAWVRRWWRALVGELCATALLVGLGVAGTAAETSGAAHPPLAHAALAFGGAVAGCAAAFGPVSGAHMNPSVSLAAALAGRLAWGAAVAYALAQTLGALLGMAALLAALPGHAGLGVTAVAQGVPLGGALALEAMATGLLALACCAAWASPQQRPDAALPVQLGLLVAGLVFAGGAATGASLNPARSLAPALLHGRWDDHWVYWVGPLAGAALASLLHTYVLSPRPPRAPCPTAPEAVPLDDKP